MSASASFVHLYIIVPRVCVSWRLFSLTYIGSLAASKAIETMSISSQHHDDDDDDQQQQDSVRMPKPPSLMAAAADTSVLRLSQLG